MTSPPYYQMKDYGHDAQIGLEEDLEEYLNDLCDVFDELKRVLKENGVFFLNIDDTYYRKSLQMIPEKLALELKERGWTLRNKIIWHKNACMPESVKDRFSHKWEYLFMFTPNRQYEFDLDTVREAYSEATKKRLSQNNGNPNFNPEDDRGHANGEKNQVEVNQFTHEKGKNPGDVWTIPTAKYCKAHFAVYPKRLCEKPIKAGCPEDGVVLDPFAGAGTTCVVAQNLGREYIGIELNPEFADLARERLSCGEV
ncbi:DNA-methyltransferase [Halococcus sediminicola]|uniref:DNA-methyltransferase n=1 Tax=Halococcus sediminicola TaxID=1264579 RepID=UPI0006790978|nr:site-specific DNA-methyltransferase [Halococcus sediminicola]